MTVLEEMPVQETADGIAELREHGIPVGGVVVNQVRPRDLDEDDLAAIRASKVPKSKVATDLNRAGLAGQRRRSSPGSSTEARDHAERRALEDSQRALVGDAGRADVRAAAAGGRHRPRRPLRARRRCCATRAWHEGSVSTRKTRSPAAAARVGPAVGQSTGGRTLDVDALLDDRHTGIIVCCGSGGVGKTTISAALALRAAERGRKVVVLTIDPARRLAQSMGIEALDNTPRPVAGVGSRRRQSSTR